MSKLPEFLHDKSLVSYTHLKSNVNLDFVPHAAKLTLTNARDKSAVKKLVDVVADDVDMVKEYCCMCGLVALDKFNMGRIDFIHKAMLTVQAESPPTYT